MTPRYKIPPDIYEQVFETVCDIVNATQADDEVLRATGYERLREFCERQTTAGRGSGFMWEALADFTEDPIQQLAYYERSLELARHNSEPTHTVLLEMGKHYAEAGDWFRAKPLLIAARQEAIVYNDLDTEGGAAAILLQAAEDDG